MNLCLEANTKNASSNDEDVKIAIKDIFISSTNTFPLVFP